VCKTKLAFQELYEAYPNKKWYLRLMDDTLVVAPNLLRMLQRVDPDKSWYEAIPYSKCYSSILASRRHAIAASG
jgi:hypothetical protein